MEFSGTTWKNQAAAGQPAAIGRKLSEPGSASHGQYAGQTPHHGSKRSFLAHNSHGYYGGIGIDWAVFLSIGI